MIKIRNLDLEARSKSIIILQIDMLLRYQPEVASKHCLKHKNKLVKISSPEVIHTKMSLNQRPQVKTEDAVLIDLGNHKVSLKVGQDTPSRNEQGYQTMEMK